jgi:hypothetical protein
MLYFILKLLIKLNSKTESVRNINNAQKQERKFHLKIVSIYHVHRKYLLQSHLHCNDNMAIFQFFSWRKGMTAASGTSLHPK